MANSSTQTTLIGSGTFVRGRVTGTGDLEIAGRIEGEVTCTGDVTVESSGLVGASISAHRIVVRGAVKATSPRKKRSSSRPERVSSAICARRGSPSRRAAWSVATCRRAAPVRHVRARPPPLLVPA